MKEADVPRTDHESRYCLFMEHVCGFFCIEGCGGIGLCHKCGRRRSAHPRPEPAERDHSLAKCYESRGACTCFGAPGPAEREPEDDPWCDDCRGYGHTVDCLSRNQAKIVCKPEPAAGDPLGAEAAAIASDVWDRPSIETREELALALRAAFERLVRECAEAAATWARTQEGIAVLKEADSLLASAEAHREEAFVSLRVSRAILARYGLKGEGR